MSRSDIFLPVIDAASAHAARRYVIHGRVVPPERLMADRAFAALRFPRNALAVLVEVAAFLTVLVDLGAAVTEDFFDDDWLFYLGRL
jgi:hypothetical protein